MRKSVGLVYIHTRYNRRISLFYGIGENRIMMKVTKVECDWWFGFEAYPVHLKFRVDAIPDPTSLVYKKKEDLYFAEKEGYVSFFYSNPKNPTGYGGRVFLLKMEDGTTRCLKGPWSSNPGTMERAGFPPSIDCTLVTNFHCGEDGVQPIHYSGNVTVAFAKENLPPEMEIINTGKRNWGHVPVYKGMTTQETKEVAYKRFGCDVCVFRVCHQCCVDGELKNKTVREGKE